MMPTAPFCPRLPVTPGQPFRASYSARPAIQSAIQNVTTYTTCRRGQKGAVGIIFDIHKYTQ